MLIRKIPWTILPGPGAKLDVSGGIFDPTKVSAILVPSASGLHDFRTNKLYSGTAPPIGVTSIGRGYGWTLGGTTEHILLSAAADDVLGATSCTIIIASIRRSSDAYPGASHGYSASAADRSMIHLPYTDNNIYWDFGNATEGSGRLSVSAASWLAAGTINVYGFAAGSRGREIWRNGVRVAVNSGATATRGTTARSFRVGNADAASASNTPADTTTIFLLSKEQFSEQALAKITANPLLLFAPQDQRIPTGVAAPSSPQFDAASNSGYKTALSTYSWSHTCSGSNRALVVCVSHAFGATSNVQSITFNGVSINQSQVAAGSGVGAEVYVLVAPAAGTYTIAVTMQSAVDSMAFAESYTGVNQVTPYEAGASVHAVNSGAADATNGISTVTYDCVIISNVTSTDTLITVGAGQTQSGNLTGAIGSGGMSKIGPVQPGTTTMRWTDIGASAGWIISALALRPVTAVSTLFTDSDLRYSILAALQADSDQRWSVLNSANADSTTQWSLLNAALADSDQRWSALNAAQGDSSQQWSILNAALADSDVRWSLLNALQSDSNLQWSVLNAILADTDQRWSVLAGVFQDSDLRWDLQSALSAVFADSDQRWSILSAVLNDADLRHSILNAVNADSDQRWSIVNAAQADGTYQWSLVAAIQNDSSLIWDLQSALAAVFQDSTLQWSLVAAVQQQLDAQWSLLNAVQIDADARWSIANAVAQDLTAQWSALGAAYKDATIQWDSLAISETTATLSWSIQSEAVPPKIISVTFSTKTRSIVFSAKTPTIVFSAKPN